MKLLGMETSGNGGSVALLAEGRIASRAIATPREQTERLLDVAHELLGEARLAVSDLDGIAFGRGPGSFTGLRLAAAVAQGLALAANLRLLPVSSLLCIAQGAWRAVRASHVLVCSDARMGEIYWGEFELDGHAMRASSAERLGRPSDLPAPSGAWTAVGSGFAAHRDALSGMLTAAQRVLPDLEPAAEDLFPFAERALAEGRSVAPNEALPVYLREHTAWRRTP
jgi:tRNA threonylcarbamoyladenosine biosynthesis protein TsaB